jgi:hypothetical protein
MPSLYKHGPTSTCAAGAFQGSLAHGTCFPFDGSGSFKYSVESLALAPGPCTPSQTGSIPTPTWAMTGRACAPASLEGSCDSETVCLPDPPAGASLCVFQEGAHSCPSEYPTTFTFHSDFVDGRSCSTCSCGSPTGTCGGQAGYFSNSSCTVSLGSGALNACAGPLSNVAAARFTASVTGVSCPPSASTPSGSVTAQNPVTFCCKP